MAESPETHYQISLTGGQAFGLVLILLLGLGIAFFLGVEAGVSRRGAAPVAESSPAEPPQPNNAAGPQESGEALVTPPAPARTTVATAAAAPGPVPSRTAPSHEVREGFGDLPPDRAQRPAAEAGEKARTASAQPRNTPAPERRAAISGQYYVQVVSTSSHAEAEKMARRLKSRSYRPVIAPLTVGKKTVYRVRVGPYTSRERAERAGERLKRTAKVSVWVVPADK